MPSCTGRSKLKSESTSSQAMAPSHSSSSHHSHSGRYQPRPSKVRMKLSRYSVRGASQSSGTDATFCVRWLVTASSSTDPVAASDSQRRYGGFAAALSSRSVLWSWLFTGFAASCAALAWLTPPSAVETDREESGKAGVQPGPENDLLVRRKIRLDDERV